MTEPLHLFSKISVHVKDVYDDILERPVTIIDWGAIQEICADYEYRIAALERNNELMAERLLSKAPEGMWLAPYNLDDELCLIAAEAPRPAGRHSIVREMWKAMRDNYLSRTKP